MLRPVADILRDIYLESEFAAELYVADVVDGRGRLLSGGLLRGMFDTRSVDRLGSVSAFEDEDESCG